MKKRGLSPWLLLPLGRLKFLLAFCLGCVIMAMALLAHIVAFDACKNMVNATALPTLVYPAKHRCRLNFEPRHLIRHRNKKNDNNDNSVCVEEDEGIFFMETSSPFAGFGGRKLCAFESTARYNSNRTVVIAMAEDAVIPTPEVRLLESLPNVQVLSVNFEALVCQSAQFALLSRLAYEWYPVQLSDILRLLFLSMFGGAYMDSDVVSLRAIPKDLKNFIVEDVKPKAELNNGIIQFQRNNQFLRLLLSRLSDPYISVSYRDSLGPRLFRSTRSQYCPSPNVEQDDPRVRYKCPDDMVVLKKSQAHRWDTWSYADLTHKNSGGITMTELRAGIANSFAVHYFGSKFDEGLLKLELKSPLMEIMVDHCPRSAEMLKSQLSKDRL